MVSGASSASSPSKSRWRSTASTPAPPPLVTIPSRPRGIGRKRDRVSAASNSSGSSITRSSPARRNAASITPSAPASAPVWVAAASAPAAWRPDLMTITGFTRAAARAADMNLRASGTVSRYSRIARVWRSPASMSSRSPTSTSAMSPSDTTVEKPMSRSALQSRTAEASAPDWDRKARWPGAGARWAKLALSPRAGRTGRSCWGR
jgi:hypothetical protein